LLGETRAKAAWLQSKNVLIFGLAILAGGGWTLAESRSAARAEEGPAASVQQRTLVAPTRYMGREIAKTMHYSGAAWLVRESRQRQEDCRQMLKELQVRPGQVICDMGCGNGFYTLRLARLTGSEGKVYAVDIQPEMLRMLRFRAREAKIDNVSPVLGSEIDPGLPENSLDLVLMVDVYHEFSHPGEMLQAIRKCLKPNGRIALVEFRAEDENVPIKRLHKMSKRQIRREFAANGFKIVRQFDGLPWQHMVFFARDSAPVSSDGR
jgi:SAM-dependent methyltransferase